MSDMPLDTVPFQSQRLVDVVKGAMPDPGASSGLAMASVVSVDYSAQTCMVHFGDTSQVSGPFTFMNVGVVAGGNVWLAPLGDNAWVVVGTTNVGFQRYVPSVAFAGGGGSFGNAGTYTLEAEWDYDGTRIVGWASGIWGTAAAGGTGDFLIGCPVPAVTSVGFQASALAMIGDGYWYDNSSGTLAPVIVRLWDSTRFRLYRGGIESASFPVTGAVPWAPAVSDQFLFNFAYRPV